MFSPRFRRYVQVGMVFFSFNNDTQADASGDGILGLVGYHSAHIPATVRCFCFRDMAFGSRIRSLYYHG